MLFLRCVSMLIIAWTICARVHAEQPPLNFLIVTVDDMNCDSVGAFGCTLPDTTPNIDRFAAEGLRFGHAHVQVGNCFPSRNVMLSGRYPHNTGVEGFYQVKNPQYPHLVDVMKEAGYFVGIRGKVSHSTPYQPYAWDADLTTIDGQKMDMKNAGSYFHSVKRGIQMADEAGKPFCLNVNISDPHKPFYATGRNGETVPDANTPSHVFAPEEVPIPGFLFDHPDVRRELAQYYSSVRRADDCFAETMRAISASGRSDNTVVMFLSDHGMPLPFAKTALWNHSTRTPWIVRWPGVTKPGTIDNAHMISAVDLMPTLLEIAGIEPPQGFDGRSIVPLLRGQPQSGREMVYKVYNENSGGQRNPMRSVQSKRFGYLFNPWSDGKLKFKTATTGTLTYRAMQQVASTNPVIAKRLALFDYGIPEEFYDYDSDPDALNNLIDDPDYASELQTHRLAMRRFMKESGDPILDVFDQRGDPQTRQQYVAKVQAEADERRRGSRHKGRKGAQNKKLFSLRLPKQVELGEDFIVVVQHRLPKQLGEQNFHVTIKDFGGKRIDRIVQPASGNGSFEVVFSLPADLKIKAINVSAFVGEDYPTNQLHRTEGPIAVATESLADPGA